MSDVRSVLGNRGRFMYPPDAESELDRYASIATSRREPQSFRAVARKLPRLMDSVAAELALRSQLLQQPNPAPDLTSAGVEVTGPIAMLAQLSYDCDPFDPDTCLRDDLSIDSATFNDITLYTGDAIKVQQISRELWQNERLSNIIGIEDYLRLASRFLERHNRLHEFVSKSGFVPDSSMVRILRTGQLALWRLRVDIIADANLDELATNLEAVLAAFG